MTSTSESQPRSTSAVKRAAVITHGKPPTIGPALDRLERIAQTAGVELLLPEEEVAKHGGRRGSDLGTADIAVVLGGDGTMLRALQRFVGTEIPVIGVNFGRVGFLASIAPDELEAGLARVFAGDYTVAPLTTLDVDTNGARASAVNDVVALTSIRGRMVELRWRIDHEDLGVQPCDGMICATPSGSTAYNLSNGEPVLLWRPFGLFGLFRHRFGIRRVALGELLRRDVAALRGARSRLALRLFDEPAVVPALAVAVELRRNRKRHDACARARHCGRGRRRRAIQHARPCSRAS